MKKVLVIGGGLSGLSVAYALLNSPQLDITLLESDPRTGGKIWTDNTEGFVCEKGANGFLDNKPRTLELCGSLGIDPVRSNENAKKRYIFSGGKLNALPESPPAFLRSDFISWPGKIRMLYDLFAPKGPEDESVADFIIRRLGKEALDKLIDPMVSGVFAGDPYKMSIKSCFPRIKEFEYKYGGLFKALIKIKRERGNSGANVSVAPPGRLTSFYDGAQKITDALSEALGSRVRLGASVHGINRSGDSYQVHTSAGIFEADIVILASPAYASADILKDLDRELSDTLSTIPYPSLSVVCLGYRREKVGHDLGGFGFLIPQKEGRKILGTLWDSSIFPNRAPEGHVLLRTMIGGAKASELAMMDDSRLLSTVMNELRPIMTLKSDPDMARIYRWERAIPQYLVGHSDKLKKIDERLKLHKGIYLAGNAYKGIGMNDCIENGYKLAEEVLRTI
ncbi:MAG: protoporphyrinogen oxidase [Thermodesulfovibrionia bacterium]|nr:protoporphyrinogen oxidase [Thermodesulfovibrionia bacterium]